MSLIRPSSFLFAQGVLSASESINSGANPPHVSPPSLGKAPSVEEDSGRCSPAPREETAEEIVAKMAEMAELVKKLLDSPPRDKGKGKMEDPPSVSPPPLPVRPVASWLPSPPPPLPVRPIVSPVPSAPPPTSLPPPIPHQPFVPLLPSNPRGRKWVSTVPPQGLGPLPIAPSTQEVAARGLIAQLGFPRPHVSQIGSVADCFAHVGAYLTAPFAPPAPPLDPSHRVVYELLTRVDGRIKEVCAPSHTPSFVEPLPPHGTLPSRPFTAAQVVDAFLEPSQDSLVVKTVMSPEAFAAFLESHVAAFRRRQVSPKHYFGWVDKVMVTEERLVDIVIRADIHGTLSDLLMHLRIYQDQGCLDEEWKCKPGVHLVFLGDYCDRDENGLEILLLLMRLREANPDQVHLLRGNHESIEVNDRFCRVANPKPDPKLAALLDTSRGKKALSDLYSTFPLALFFDEGTRALACMHACPNLLVDLAPLFASPGDAMMTIPRAPTFSERLQSISKGDPRFPDAVKVASAVRGYLSKVVHIESEHPGSRLDYANNDTIFCWGDVNEGSGPIAGRHIQFSLDEIWAYLRLQNRAFAALVLGHRHRDLCAVSPNPEDPIVFVLGYPSTRPEPSLLPMASLRVFHVSDGAWAAQAIHRKGGDALRYVTPAAPLFPRGE